MSIERRLSELVDGDQLVPFESLIDCIACRRTLLMTTEVAEEIFGDVWNDPDLGMRYARLAADLQRFAEGDLIPVRMDPDSKDKSALLARVSPVEYGIWAIRSVAPRPAIRVFGAFAATDTFVCLKSSLRKDLDGPDGPRWARARENAIAVWERLFDDLPRMTKGELHDFVSEEAQAV